MFGKKNTRIKELENLLAVERYKADFRLDMLRAYEDAFRTALTKDEISMEQCEEIHNLQAKYYRIRREESY